MQTLGLFFSLLGSYEESPLRCCQWLGKSKSKRPTAELDRQRSIFEDEKFGRAANEA